jgi:SAM-dependent methyltransferase
MPGPEIARVEDDERDFYGRRYWFEYQERELGTPDITVRARRDLPERCVYWLRTLLHYRVPPRRVLDVGCGHGGFVMLLRRAGFDATGLELSPWVVNFARRTFGAPVMQGPLEAHALAAGSVDIIIMTDVLEHLADPVATLTASLAALADDGIIVIQTPAVPRDVSWDAMVADDHPFLPLMRERGHLYLFSDMSLRRLLTRVGIEHVVFEPAYFSAYDMFAVAGRQPLACPMPPAVLEALQATPDSRLVLALLDLDERLNGLQARYLEAEQDRAARLAALHEYGARLAVAEDECLNLTQRLAAAEAERATYAEAMNEGGARLAASEADRVARLAVIQEQGERISVLGHELAGLRRHLVEIEADRAARLTVIEEQAKRLDASEADRAARLAVIEEQAKRLDASEADRAARLAVIQEQGHRLAISEADRAARLQEMEVLEAANQGLRAELDALRFRDVRAFVRRLARGVWGGLARAADLLAFRRADPSSPPATPASDALVPEPPPVTPVAVHQTLDDYVTTIDAFVQARPDLAPVRGYNHAMVDVLDSAVPLSGHVVLDVGASPHGFSLEHTLRKGAAEYIGMGLGVWEPVVVHHGAATGRVVQGKAEALPLDAESVDVAMSLSTFEHFADGPAVLREIHRVLRPAGQLFVNFQPVWTSSEGHHLHHLESVTRLIPPWAHLLWTPEGMRRALESRWPPDAPLTLDEAVAWIYESSEINRIDVVTLRRVFEASPFDMEWMAPLPEDRDLSGLAAYLARVLPFSADDLLTRGFSIMLRKR